MKILDEGGYTRYDFKTADKLLLAMGNLEKEYSGSLNALHQRASDSVDLETRLKALGKGIGNVTVSIFLRDLRGVWKKADPAPTPLVLQAAKNLGMIKNHRSQKALEEMKSLWGENHIKGYSFIHFETALLRLGKEQRRKKRPFTA